MQPFPGKPIGIRAPHGAKDFEISWPDNSKDSLPHRILRGYCPCAGCQGHGGSISFQKDAAEQASALELRDIQPVGNYALSLRWGDAHDTGIFSFEFLWRLSRLQEEHGVDGLVELGTLPR